MANSEILKATPKMSVNISQSIYAKADRFPILYHVNACEYNTMLYNYFTVMIT